MHGESNIKKIYICLHRTIQNKQYTEQHNNFGRVRAVPRLGELYPGICLTTEEKARKNLSQGILTYLLTPWSRAPLEKLLGSVASQEIPCIFGTWRFHPVPTSARHPSLSWANSIQSPVYYIYYVFYTFGVVRQVLNELCGVLAVWSWPSLFYKNGICCASPLCQPIIWCKSNVCRTANRVTACCLAVSGLSWACSQVHTPHTAPDRLHSHGRKNRWSSVDVFSNGMKIRQ
jgi:hypothetical protein